MNDIANLERQTMDELTAGLPDNKSEKIRRLAAAGYKRADIARYLDVRYQFVYNVLSAPQRKTKRPQGQKAASPAAEASGQEPRELPEAPPRWVWTKIRRSGHIELPAAFLEVLGVGEGDEVQLALDEGMVRVLNRETALRDLQRQVRRYVPEGVSLVDELLADRRAEAAKEVSDGADG
jgi:antitoxin component of MazEF toxin-antitoxin module